MAAVAAGRPRTAAAACTHPGVSHPRILPFFFSSEVVMVLFFGRALSQKGIVAAMVGPLFREGAFMVHVGLVLQYVGRGLEKVPLGTVLPSVVQSIDFPLSFLLYEKWMDPSRKTSICQEGSYSFNFAEQGVFLRKFLVYNLRIKAHNRCKEVQ